MDLTADTVDIDVSGASVVEGTIACGDAEFNISRPTMMLPEAGGI